MTMDPSKFLEASTHEFASYVIPCLTLTPPAARRYYFPTAPFIEIPVIGGKFFAGQEPVELRQAVFNALCARAQFNGEKPDWAPDDLPLRWH